MKRRLRRFHHCPRDVLRTLIMTGAVLAPVWSAPGLAGHLGPASAIFNIYGTGPQDAGIKGALTLINASPEDSPYEPGEVFAALAPFFGGSLYAEMSLRLGDSSEKHIEGFLGFSSDPDFVNSIAGAEAFVAAILYGEDFNRPGRSGVLPTAFGESIDGQGNIMPMSGFVLATGASGAPECVNPLAKVRIDRPFLPVSDPNNTELFVVDRRAACQGDERFGTFVQFRRLADPTFREGTVQPTSSPEITRFAFEDPNDPNIDPNASDLSVQVIDMCAGAGQFAVSYQALTDAAFALTVIDTQTGEVKRYDNPLGTVPPVVTDMTAFANCP